MSTAAWAKEGRSAQSWSRRPGRSAGHGPSSSSLAGCWVPGRGEGEPGLESPSPLPQPAWLAPRPCQSGVWAPRHPLQVPGLSDPGWGRGRDSGDAPRA